jgi:hypothetical protein
MLKRNVLIVGANEIEETCCESCGAQLRRSGRDWVCG